MESELTLPVADLATRLMDCPLFELVAGMLLTDGCAVAYRVHHDGMGLHLIANIPGATPQSADGWRQSPLGLRPVLADDATAGCLFGLRCRELLKRSRHASIGTSVYEDCAYVFNQRADTWGEAEAMGLLYLGGAQG